MKYISKLNKKYCIYKWCNGKNVYFGTFNTLKEAQEYRDFLINHDWDLKYRKRSPRKYNLPKYIYKKPGGDMFIIRKTVDYQQVHLGYYKTLQEAIKEKEFYESINWDLDLLDLY